MKRFFLLVSLIFLSPLAQASEQVDLESISTWINGRRYYTGYRAPTDDGALRTASWWRPTPDQVAALPSSYDLRDFGLSTPVLNQGSCGSCWSFARTAALESAFLKAGHVLPLDLAEQDTLVNDDYSSGCNGGYMDGRFEVSQGLTTEALCPYRASHRYACNGQKYGKAVSWSMVGTDDGTSVDDLRAALFYKGALAVTVAAGSSFSPNGGRITTCGSRSINHMVTLVGYRPNPSGDSYEFLIKNSWGSNWGDGGFAWSKQGCNRLASANGDAALFFEVEPTTPPVPPDCEALYQQLGVCKNSPGAGCRAAYMTFGQCVSDQ